MKGWQPNGGSVVWVISPSWSDRLTEQRGPVQNLDDDEVGSPRALELVQPDRDPDDAVPDEWLQKFEAHAKKVDEYQERLKADAELLGVLQFGGFAGPVWEELATAFAEYGYQVIRAWILTGHIYVLCAQRRICLNTILSPNRPVPRDHQIDDLTQDTISLAIEKFRERVLVPGKWSPKGGASLKTYFIGQALFRFGDTFRRWALSERRQSRVADGLGFDMETHHAAHAVAPAEQVIERELIGRYVAGMDEQTRAIVLLTSNGYDQTAIGEMLGISTRAVEGKLYRYRKRMEGRNAVA
jgi:DNA-directed RNA polymerase specialized sigma24 family protein